ncbi:hypothetical protein E2C01_013810 [Portunus trituberculatus]|uniref:Uncharacterized protein n=1 Tax=Portunus trituberculatus TaxID=210409 RepID=A0A5B7DHK9_PORTR|nr:hypothetical protein [Portunus trituberculatus]
MKAAMAPDSTSFVPHSGFSSTTTGSAAGVFSAPSSSTFESLLNFPLTLLMRRVRRDSLTSNFFSTNLELKN